MTPKIINEAIFQAIFDSIGMGNAWTVLKGRFLTAFRAWGSIIDIWKADSAEEIKKIQKKSDSDINEIKSRYRDAETQYAKNNSGSIALHGGNMMFFAPAFAMAEALVGPLMDETYRSDVRRLLPYTGIQDWGLTPDFISEWIESESKTEKQTARAVVAGEDGTKQTIDIFSYTEKGDETQDSLNSLHGLFVESAETRPRLKEAAKPFDIKDAERLAAVIVSAYESQGILKKMEATGREIKETKEKVINDVVIPSAETIKVLSDMLSSEDIDGFVDNMKILSKINKSLKSLNPQDFKVNVKSSADQIMDDETMLNNIKKDTKSNELTKDDVELLIFTSARNDFAKGTIGILEKVYEDNLSLLMKDITEKGLEEMKKTQVGKEYAELIENNIQLLENAIKSLNNLAKQGV